MMAPSQTCDSTGLLDARTGHSIHPETLLRSDSRGATLSWFSSSLFGHFLSFAEAPLLAPTPDLLVCPSVLSPSLSLSLSPPSASLGISSPALMVSAITGVPMTCKPASLPFY